MENFIPSPKGEVKRRSGLKHIRWQRKTMWARLKMWWYGDPMQVSQILEFKGQLFAATDRGLYVMHGDVLKPVPYVVEVAA